MAPVPHAPPPQLLLMLKGLWPVWGLGWKAVVDPTRYALCVALEPTASLNPVSLVRLGLPFRLAPMHLDSKA